MQVNKNDILIKHPKMGDLKLLGNIGDVALLERLQAEDGRYVVAIGFDFETITWNSGIYSNYFETAFEDFREMAYLRKGKQITEAREQIALNKVLEYLENNFKKSDDIKTFGELLIDELNIEDKFIRNYEDYRRDKEYEYNLDI